MMIKKLEIPIGAFRVSMGDRHAGIKDSLRLLRYSSAEIDILKVHKKPLIEEPNLS